MSVPSFSDHVRLPLGIALMRLDFGDSVGWFFSERLTSSQESMALSIAASLAATGMACVIVKKRALLERAILSDSA